MPQEPISHVHTLNQANHIIFAFHIDIKQVMKSISIEPINNESIDEILEFQLQDSTNIEELYENIRMRVMEQYGDCDFQFEQVVIYQKKNPYRRLGQNMKLTQMSTGKIELVILFPRENTPIIILQLGDKEYFISEYTKFDKLSQILNKIKGQVSTVIQQQKFDKIAINGIDINYSQEKSESFRKFMQGHINKTISIVIHAQKCVEIPKKQQTPIEKEPGSNKKEIFQSLPKIVLQEPQAFELQGDPHQKVEAKPENRQNKRNQTKDQIPIRQQKAQKVVSKPNNKVQVLKVQIPPVQQKNKVEQVVTFPKKLQNPLQLIINFETQSGKTQKSIQANRAHSLLQMLPSIVSALKQAGFQWQSNEYDHNRDRDKLRIIIDGNNQFKKMDRPFRQLVSQTQGQLILTFERHYEGGKGGNE